MPNTDEIMYIGSIIFRLNEQEYIKHVALSHENKPAYPSKADLERNKLKPQGKECEI
jgi:hypothetical protein